MLPIHELLARIRWDKAFGAAQFNIGYYDRVEGKLLYVPLQETSFPGAEHGIFELLDEDGVTHSIPLHRIKEVYRDDVLIWHREH